MVEENGKTEPSATQGAAAKCPDWLTESVFEDLLAADFENYSSIKRFHVAPAVSTGENYMTVLVRVFIDVELKDGTTAQTSYVVKLPPDSEERLSNLTEWRVFPKEKFIYSELIPEFEELFRKAGRKVRFAPRMLKPQKAQIPEDAFVMEDLRQLEFKNIKRQQGFDMAHTKAVLTKLAQFHAASACRFEAKGPYPEMFDHCLSSKEDLFSGYRTKILQSMLENLKRYNAPHLHEKLETYTAIAPDQYMAKSPLDPNEFNVLNHGDCWANNVMFRYDSDGGIRDTYFVDFQLSRYGSPAQDLQYMLLSSTSLENKLNNFDYFIHYYHKQLVDNLQLLNYSRPLPQLRDLHISLLRHGDWAYAIATALLPIVLLDQSDNATSDNLLAENENSNDLRTAMFTNERYAEHMSQLLPWMERRGLLDYTL